MGKILIISFWNPTSFNPGKGIFIKDQVDALFKQSNNIIFIGINILPNRSLYRKEVIINKIEGNYNITINIYSIFWKFIFVLPDLIFISISKLLKNKFPDYNPDIIHSNVIFPCAFVGHRLSKYFNAKHIISEHWSKFYKILENPFYGKKALKIYQSCNATICVSNYLLNTLQSKTECKNMFQVPNIIDAEIFNFDGIKTTNNNYINFLCIATWELPKRLDLIIGSLCIFAEKSNKKLVLNIIGEGSQKGKFTSELFPDNFKVNFLGYMLKQDIAIQLHNTDYLMHASNEETFSIVIAEAISTGTPVLASNVGAIPELITNDNGILVENDLEAWVEGLGEILSFDYNRMLISQKSQEKYTPKTIANKLKSIYAQILQ